VLAKRIIPTMLCRGRALVKGIGFDAWRVVGNAAQAVQIHNMRGVDELVLLDISATEESRGPDLALVESLAEVCFMPLAVGGGVRCLEHVRQLLHAGADKVVIGSEALRNPLFVREVAQAVGNQAVVVSVDARDERCCAMAGALSYDYPPVAFAQLMAIHGAGEILLQSVPRDGMMEGYDLELIRKVSRAVDVPVIASGGCGSYEHMLQALLAGADAVAAGAMFLFTDATPRGAAAYLRDNGVEVRI
jgi:cyclase